MKKITVLLVPLFVILLVVIGGTSIFTIFKNTENNLNEINLAKQKSAEASAINFIASVEKTILISKFGDNVITVGDGAIYIVQNGVLTKESGEGTTTIEINYTGAKPNGKIVFGLNEEVTTATLTFEQIYDGEVIYSINQNKK